MEARPEAARRLALPKLERALDGVRGTTAVHICFGYPAFVPDHPPAYSFLTELAGSSVDQISIEAAQSEVQLSVLEQLAGKTIILGVIALDSEEVESAEQVADHLRRTLAHTPAQQLVAAPDCGMKYLSRDAGARQATA